MESKISFIFILSLFNLAVISAQNISCYECTSNQAAPNEDCLDPMSPNVTQVSCPVASGCVKYYYNLNQTINMVRSCNLDNSTCQELGLISTTNPGITNFNCRTCNTDGCNSNSAITVGVTVVALFAGMVAARTF